MAIYGKLNQSFNLALASMKGDDMYEVQGVIGKKHIKNKVFYKVKWKGYPQSESTWEVQNNLKYVKDLIQEFQSKCQLVKEEKTCRHLSTKVALSQSHRKLARDKKADKGQIIIQISDSEIDSPIQQQRQTHLSIDTNFIKLRQSRQIQNAACLKVQKCQSSIESDLRKSDSASFKNAKSYEISFQQRFKQAFHNKTLPQKRLKVITKGEPTSKRKRKPQNSEKILLDKTIRSDKSQNGNDKQTSYDISQNSPEVTNQSMRSSQLLSRLQNLQSKRLINQTIKIRLLDDCDRKDIIQYLVQYQTGAMKILSSFQLVITHPIEFINYLQQKAHHKTK